MTPESTRAQPVEAIDDLVRAAAARKQPVAAIYDGFPRLLCPHLLGRNKEGRLRTLRSAISLEGAAACAWRRRETEWAVGAVSPWTSSVKSSCARAIGAPKHAQTGKVALRKSSSMPTLSLETTRKKGSEAIAAARGAPERCVALRSSADYAARGVRGDPRGRKFGAGPGATNPRCPARAEGEKRLRSATRNP